MSNAKKLTQQERHKWEKELLEQISRIGESVKDITPENGHLSMTWFPDGHMDVFLCSGETVKDKDGNERSVMILDAWGDMESGKLKVSRV